MLIKYGCATLRAIEEKDLEILLTMLNSPEIEEMTGGVHLPVSELEERKWVQNYHNDEKNIRLVIELINGKAIGMVSLTEIDYINRTAHFGIKTYAKVEDRLKNDTFEAGIALFLFGFNYLNLNCITGKTLVFNSFSLKLQKRLGFKQEGILRKRIYRNGEYHDVVSTSLLREDFFAVLKKYDESFDLN